MSTKQEYFITVNGEAVSVTQEIYETYYKMGRRSRYLENDVKYGKSVKDKNGKTYFRESKEDSIERLSLCGMEPFSVDTYPSDNEFDSAAFLLLSKALEILSEDEKSIVSDLYFKNKSARQTASERKVSHTAINKRNKTIIQKLRKYFEKMGFHFE